MSVKVMRAVSRATFGALVIASSPFLYDWALGSSWSIHLQMIPVLHGVGSTSIIQAQVVLLILLLASGAGAITISSLSVVAGVRPPWSALSAGLAVLLISEDYELSQVILGVPTAGDFFALALVAVYALVGWAAATFVVRRVDPGKQDLR